MYIYILKYIYIYIIYTQIINLLGQHTHTQFCLAAAQQQFQKAKPRKPVALLQWKQHLYLYHGSTTYFNLLGNCGPQLFPTDFLLISMNYVAHPTVPLRTLANICLYILWNFGGLGLQNHKITKMLGDFCQSFPFFFIQIIRIQLTLTSIFSVSFMAIPSSPPYCCGDCFQKKKQKRFLEGT